MIKEEKLRRLVEVSRMYYEENRTQAEIAKRVEVSRPMVSKLLTEARALGIVTIHITEATNFRQIMGERLAEKFQIRSAFVVPMEKDEERTDNGLVRAAFELVAKRMGERGCLGVSWGSLIGRLTDYVETRSENDGCSSRLKAGPGGAGVAEGVVCPLIGDAAASYRSYHPNELVRILSQKTGLSPAYLYGPAMAETEAEKEVYANTDSCRRMRELWKELSVAVVNVSNHPSSPDMATASRFGTRLSEERAVGHFLSYFYDEEGRFIREDSDRMLRISRESLAMSGAVVALCASGVKAPSARGALRTGLITDVILNEELAAELLRQE